MALTLLQQEIRRRHHLLAMERRILNSSNWSVEDNCSATRYKNHQDFITIIENSKFKIEKSATYEL